MKKFYEAPVVELTGFSVEDVITTSVIAPVNTVNTASMDDIATEKFLADINASSFDAAVNFNGGIYQW